MCNPKLKISAYHTGEGKATSKKSVMREKARTRIRGYFYKSKEHLQNQFVKGHKCCVDQLFKDFRDLLKEHDYNGHYFVRGEVGALCDKEGRFDCQGAFDTSSCTNQTHRINPYGCREWLLCFSTWNLDHGQV